MARETGLSTGGGPNDATIPPTPTLTPNAATPTQEGEAACEAGEQNRPGRRQPTSARARPALCPPPLTLHPTPPTPMQEGEMACETGLSTGGGPNDTTIPFNAPTSLPLYTCRLVDHAPGRPI
jgi:hypothetical protein